MNNKSAHKLSSFRFRRWSRKAFATFLSLNKEISIGRVAASITEKALLKTNAIAAVIAYFTPNNTQDTLDEEDEVALTIEQLEVLQTIVLTTNVKVGGRFSNKIIQSNIIRLIE